MSALRLHIHIVHITHTASLRFEKTRKNIDRFRGFIETFSNRSEAVHILYIHAYYIQLLGKMNEYSIRNIGGGGGGVYRQTISSLRKHQCWLIKVTGRASLRFEKRLNLSINPRKLSIFRSEKDWVKYRYLSKIYREIKSFWDRRRALTVVLSNQRSIASQYIIIEFLTMIYSGWDKSRPLHAWKWMGCFAWHSS